MGKVRRLIPDEVKNDFFDDDQEVYKNRADYLKQLNTYVKSRRAVRDIELGACYFSIDYLYSQGWKRDTANFTGHLLATYNDRMLNLIKSCKDDPVFAVRLEGRDFKYEDRQAEHIEIAGLPDSVIQPEQWAKQIAAQNMRAEKKNNLATTDMFKCSKCGERKSRISRVQTRSADEPMTTFITCQICAFTFRQ
jgi:DNA-directed RNA polymerase subunit M/transcription elongation factor TFIIS